MPYTIKLPQKKVTINDDIKNILDAFEDAYRQTFQDETTPGSTPILGEEKLKSGFIAKIYKIYEGISGGKIGSTDRILPELNQVYLNSCSERIYYAYVSYLNQIIKESGFEPCETEAKELDDPYLLTRELLLRLVALTLCTEMRGNFDGEQLIKMLNKFVENVRKGTMLVEKNYLTTSKISIMQKKLASLEHNRWIHTFSITVDAIKTLTAMNDLITRWLDLLKERRHQISRYIITLLDPKKSREDLSVNWITDTLSEIETALIKKADETSTDQKFLTSLEEKKLEKMIVLPRVYKICQQQISDSTSLLKLGRKTSKSLTEISRIENYLKQLYSLLQQTIVLENLLSNLEGIHSVLGWFPIIMGIIDCSRLDSLFTLYDKRYVEIYSDIFEPIKTSLPQIPDSSAAAALILDEISLKCGPKFSGTFRGLQEASHLEKIRSFTEDQFYQLSRLEPELDQAFGIGYSIINIKHLGRIKAPSLLSSQTSAIAGDYKSNLLQISKPRISVIQKLPETENESQEEGLLRQHIHQSKSKMIIQRQAESGDPDSQYCYASLSEGHERTKWLSKAAGQGHLKAQNELAACYFEKDSAEKDQKNLEIESKKLFFEQTQITEVNIETQADSTRQVSQRLNLSTFQKETIMKKPITGQEQAHLDLDNKDTNVMVEIKSTLVKIDEQELQSKLITRKDRRSRKNQIKGATMGGALGGSLGVTAGAVIGKAVIPSCQLSQLTTTGAMLKYMAAGGLGGVVLGAVAGAQGGKLYAKLTYGDVQAEEEAEVRRELVKNQRKDLALNQANEELKVTTQELKLTAKKMEQSAEQIAELKTTVNELKEMMQQFSLREPQHIPSNIDSRLVENKLVEIKTDSREEKFVNFQEIKVTKDHNNLFWAAALAFLLPVAEDKNTFDQFFKRLFGVTGSIKPASNIIPINSPTTRETVRQYLLTYDRQKSIPQVFAGTYLDHLVCKIFRGKVTDKLIEISNDSEQEKIAQTAGKRNWDEYTEQMRQTSFGGEHEIHAMSELGHATIRVWSSESQSQEYSYTNAKHIVNLLLVDKHYHFRLPQKNSSSKSLPSISSTSNMRFEFNNTGSYSLDSNSSSSSSSCSSSSSSSTISNFRTQ